MKKILALCIFLTCINLNANEIRQKISRNSAQNINSENIEEEKIIIKDHVINNTIDYLSLYRKSYKEVMENNNPYFLDSLTCREIKFVRNTLFATKGYIFTKEVYSRYFNSQNWYIAKQKDVKLTPEETEFINILLKHEL